MKWYPNNLKTALGKGDLPTLVLIYGEDGGLVSELAQETVKASGVDLDDPFAGDRIDANELVQEPGRLLEAATTVSFGGGKRLVKVDGANSSLTAAELTTLAGAVESCLETALSDVTIVLPVPGLEAKHALAKLVEKNAQAAAVRCFHDSARDITTVIRDFFHEAGKKITPDAVAFLTENLGNDRSVTKHELTKLDLYTLEQAEVRLEDCLAVVTNAPSISVFKLCDAIGNRDTKQTDALLTALQQEGEDMNFIATMVLRHLRRVQTCQQMVAKGMDVSGAMSRLKPPVMVNKPLFEAQVRKYPKKRLESLSDRFYDIQAQSRQGLVPDSLVTARALLGLAA